MQNVQEFKKEYQEIITLAQSSKIDEIEKDHGIRSIWYDSIDEMIQICTENTGIIIGVLTDGSAHS